ncbi:perforin-1-like [Gastrophryne carolinensis]
MLPILIFLISITSATSQTPPPLTSDCHRATKENCSKALFVPGHVLLGEGFDIVTMKQKRSQLLDMQRFATNNDSCTICYNRNVKTWQKLPLAMVDWRHQASCSRKISSEVSQSSSSLAEEAASQVTNDWQADLSVSSLTANGKLSLAGSHSELEEFAQTKKSSDRYTFTKNQFSCVYYSFRLSRSPPLSDDLSQALSALPSAYDDRTKQQYRNFISLYGTHFIRQAEVGGRALEVSAIRTCQATMDGLSVDELNDCLSIEASAAVTGKVTTEGSAKFNACKSLSEKANRGQSFHQTFSERSWQVSGGNIDYVQLSFDGTNANSAASFRSWTESLKEHPDIVSFSLDPIHKLVDTKGRQRENLRKAISEYIMDNAVTKDCSCSVGAPVIRGEQCSCMCHGSDSRVDNCCPSKRGFANVVITVQSAKGLWGDYFTFTDAYVKISLGSKSVQTTTVMENDNPFWNEKLDLQVRDISVSELKVEVWDEDEYAGDDLLGKCRMSIISGKSDEVCYLKHGSLTFTVSAECIPHLTGPHCTNYAPSTK